MAPIKPRSTAKLKDFPVSETIPGTHIGALLRQAREERKLTIENVADELMIRRFYLDALEQGMFKDLPERVYATGFVRSYAQMVGIDPVDAVEQFKRDAYGTRSGSHRVELTMPEPIVQSVVPNRTAISVGVVAILAVAIGVFLTARDKTPAPSAIPTPPAAADIAEAPVTPPPAAAAAPMPSSEGFEIPAAAAVKTEPSPAIPPAAPSAAEAAQKKEIFIEALQSAWVEVKDAKGTVLFTNILKQGQKLPIPDQPGITVTTGNAGGLRPVLNGQALPALGAQNEVKRNLSLNSVLLSKR